MKGIEDLISDLADGLPTLVAEPGGIRVGVTEVSVELPVESRIEDDARLVLCAPRGRLSTGFGSVRHGRMRVRFVSEGA